MPPLTEKGAEILHNMEKTYPSKEKAEQVLYASRNAGRITGIDSACPIHSYMDAASRGDDAAMKAAAEKMRR
jgi:hypothetical protein